MSDFKTYKKNTEKKLGYRVTFWASLAAFFSHNSVFDQAIDEIKKKTLRETLEADAQQLRNDFYKANFLS